MDSYVILVTYTTKPGQREAFIYEVFSTGLIEQIRHEEGCLCYNYFCSVEEENELLLVEKWASMEHQQFHMEQPHMASLKEIKERYVIQTKLEERKVCIDLKN